MLVSRSVEILETAINDINKLEPDLVVHCGDLTNDSEEENFRRASKLFKKLRCPCYFVPGNHDTWFPDSRRTAMNLLNLKSLHYTVEFKDFLLLFIDVAYWRLKDGRIQDHIDWSRYEDIDIPEDEIRWIDYVLSNNADRIVLAFLHRPLVFKDSYPVSRMPQGKPVEKRPVSLGAWSENSNKNKLLAVLDKYECVKAVFAGHLHFHDINIRNNVLHCTTGALVSYPNEFRLVKVSRHHIEVVTKPLSNPEFSKQSYVAEWGNTWVRGGEADRSCNLEF